MFHLRRVCLKAPALLPPSPMPTPSLLFHSFIFQNDAATNSLLNSPTTTTNRFTTTQQSSPFSTMSMDDIIITKKCAQHLKKMVDKGIATEPRLRLSVESGGCSGFSYKFDVDDTDIDEEEDLVFVRDGVEVIVDDTSIEFVKGATVDYEQELIRSGFAILNNPNIDGPGCGCGVSFSLKE